jgi:transposase InsO family protein
MYMPYTTNPHLPKLRMQAAKLVIDRLWTTRAVARHTGFNQSTIVRWVKETRLSNRKIIATKSSRPHSHPKALASKVVGRILELRAERKQCADILHHRLAAEGINISLSSVKRTISRHNLQRFDKHKKWHQYPPRPMPDKPGMLVEIDTVWDGASTDRLYIYTLIDVCSRWAFAWPYLKANTFKSIAFLERAKVQAPFKFITLQSDHGSEFATRFTERLLLRGMTHRHSRIRTPNDNAHLERFNRTIQAECLRHIPRSLKSYQKEIPEFLKYYNTERPHMGLGMKTPMEVMRSY